MTSTEQRTTTVLPTPRSGAADDRPALRDPERSRRTPRRRPPSQYWDVTTASWRPGDRSAGSRR